MRYAIGLLVVGSLLGSAITAEAINLTPEQTGCTSDISSSLDAVAIYGALDGCFDVSAPALDLIYARDVNNGEGGGYADAYNIVLSPSRAAGNLTYVSPTPSFVCVECYLVVMDGTQSPTQYLFDITGWSGITPITFRNFWPGPGSITNITIWGTSIEPLVPETDGRKSGIPEPTTFMLIGLGAVGASRAFRRRPNAVPAAHAV